MKLQPGTKIRYLQPHNIEFPSTGNPALDDYMGQYLHNKGKHEARQRYKRRVDLRNRH